MGRMDMNHISVGILGIPSKEDKFRIKITIIRINRLVNPPDSAHCIVAHCNLGINEITSLSSYKDYWSLDTGATSHMTFRKTILKN